MSILMIKRELDLEEVVFVQRNAEPISLQGVSIRESSVSDVDL
jgi:hypothetical protein